MEWLGTLIAIAYGYAIYLMLMYIYNANKRG